MCYWCIADGMYLHVGPEDPIKEEMQPPEDYSGHRIGSHWTPVKTCVIIDSCRSRQCTAEHLLRTSQCRTRVAAWCSCCAHPTVAGVPFSTKAERSCDVQLAHDCHARKQTG